MGSPIDGGVVVITGASSGIGEHLARLAAPRAKKLVLVARRRARLEALARALEAAHPALELVIEEVDLASRAATDALAARLAALPVDVLVNNAGVGLLGVFDRSEPGAVRAMLDLNVDAPLALTRAVLPGMVARARGGILNVSSGFGLSFLPGFAAYIGTKHFVTGFTEALRADLTGTGVRATQVCPGPVDTEFESRVGNFTGRRPPRLLTVSAERCARVALQGFDRDRALVVPGVILSAVMAMNAITPRFVLRLFASLGAGPLRKAELAARGAAPVARTSRGDGG
jgi:short-subunit dehydrogenase